jgi:hypothetical protein
MLHALYLIAATTSAVSFIVVLVLNPYAIGSMLKCFAARVVFALMLKLVLSANRAPYYRKRTTSAQSSSKS